MDSQHIFVLGEIMSHQFVDFLKRGHQRARQMMVPT